MQGIKKIDQPGIGVRSIVSHMTREVCAVPNHLRLKFMTVESWPGPLLIRGCTNYFAAAEPYYQHTLCHSICRPASHFSLTDSGGL